MLNNINFILDSIIQDFKLKNYFIVIHLLL